MLLGGGCAPPSRPNLPATSPVASAPPQSGQEAGYLLASALESLRSSTDEHTIRSAREQLNRFLERRRDAIGSIDADELQRLTELLGESAMVEVTRNRSFEELDANYLRDALFLHSVARSLVRADDAPLAKAVRLFEWVVRYVQIVPVGSQAQLAPTDVCLRGLGDRNERTWVFLELLRQADVSGVALISDAQSKEHEHAWLCGVLDGNDVRLFEPELGLPVLTPAGSIATLKDVIENPELMAQFSIDPKLPYRTRPSERLACRLVIEPAMVSPRMTFLERHLSGAERANLHLDCKSTLEKNNQAAKVVLKGSSASVWSLPLRIRQTLRSDPNHRAAFQQQMELQWMITPARSDQLRGRHEKAVRAMVDLEMEKVSNEDAKRIERMPAYVRQFTFNRTRQSLRYFVGLSKLDQSEPQPQVAEKRFAEYIAQFGNPTIRPNDGVNVAAWCEQVVSGFETGKPSPGARIWRLLSEPLRADFRTLANAYRAAKARAADPTEPNAAASKSAIFEIDALAAGRALDALNSLIRNPELYAATDFVDLPLSDESRELLQRPSASLTECELIRRNRAILLAAFPQALPHDQFLWLPGAIRHRAVALFMQGKSTDAIELLSKDHPGLLSIHRAGNLALAEVWKHNRRSPKS